ncbi:hypothetical protein GCM10009789_20890 [Kribbella sancticallisti]|uniref:DUF2339 domain-containing protein n=1 Tax=Kribbella sancticallisti TaxID=460087 RepID=A0ABP4NT76_9ACTN
MSPQATLLSLGVLLLLAAGVTFLAVNWDNLSVPIQASIIATLAALAFAGSVPAGKTKLAGTAEALAILGTGLLTVDLYGARELGLISPATIDGLTYAGLAAAAIATVNLLMSRIAPKVVTYGVAAVIIGQLPLPLILVNRVNLATFLFGLLIQVVITFFWSAKGTRFIRTTGVVCAAAVFWTLLIIGCGRVFLGLLALDSPRTQRSFLEDLFDGSLPGDVFGSLSGDVVGSPLSPVLATTAVVCLAAFTGIVLLRRIALPRAFPPALGESLCAAAAAFAVATCLPQIPDAGRWLTTAAATLLALAALLRTRRTGVLTIALETAAVVVASINLLVCLVRLDVLQLGLISAIAAGLALIAAWRKAIDPCTAAITAGFTAQLAIILVTFDGLFTLWTGAILLALVAATATAIACVAPAVPLERALLSTAASAAALAEIVILLESATTGTGVILTITAAPLVAYGMRPHRREALLIAGLLLAIANTAFVLGAGATTIEWFTLPPAAVVLALGLLAWRDQPSWVYLGPGLLLGLVPSTLVANSNEDYLRTTFVVAAAVLIILIGSRHSLQAPFLIGAAVLLKITLWQFLEVAPLIPRWITLGTAGLILLTVGATYERRLQNAKHAARWVAALR